MVYGLRSAVYSPEETARPWIHQSRAEYLPVIKPMILLDDLVRLHDRLGDIPHLAVGVASLLVDAHESVLLR